MIHVSAKLFFEQMTSDTDNEKLFFVLPGSQELNQTESFAGFTFSPRKMVVEHDLVAIEKLGRKLFLSRRKK